MASVPGTPVIQPRPTATNQTLEFWWSPPVSDGGSPITSYILTDGTNTFNLPPSGYYRAQGLANGTIYPFTIAASNAIGVGAYVPFRAVQPGFKPDPPVNLTFSSINTSNTDYLITWTNPANVGQATLNRVFLQAYPLDTNGSTITTSTNLIVKRTMFGGAAGENQSRIVPLISGYNYKVLVQTINDPGYSLPTSYTSTIQLLSTVITAFSPSTFAGMQLWLDAADSTTFNFSTTTSTVTQWRDKSGNLRHAIPLQGQPFYSNTAFSNSKPGVVIWNASTLYAPVPTNTFPSSSHFFVVFQKTSTAFGGAGDTVIARTINSIPGPFDVYNTTRYWGNGSNTFTTSNVNFNLSLASNMNNWNFNVTSNAWNEYLNGSTISTLTGLSGYRDAASNFYIGTRQDLTTGARAFMGEILGYNKSLTTTERQTVEGYLGWKWGLSTLLPTWHPFYTRAPLSSDSNLDFSPSSLGTMQVWLDGADRSTLTYSSGSNISTWLDKSGSANTATSGGTAPTYNSNTSTVSFGGAGYMNTGFSASLSNETTFLVFNASNITGFQQLFGTQPAGRQIFFGTSPNGSMYVKNNGGGTVIAPPSYAIAATTNYIFAYQNNGTQTSLYFNSSNVVTSNSVSYTAGKSNVLGAYYNGSSYGDFYTGSMSEILSFSTVLNLQRRQQAEGYLAWKWGLQGRLPSTHLYYFRPPTNKDTFTSFSPSSVGSMMLWLDAADPTTFTYTTGSNVATWSDKSGRGFNASAPSGNNPVYNSSLSRVQFNGTSTFMSNLSYSYNLSQRSMFIVLEGVTNGNNAGVFPQLPTPNSGSDGSSPTSLSLEASANGLRFYGNNGGYTQDVGVSALTKSIYENTMNGTAGSTYLNGSNNSNATANYTATTCSGYGIGARWQSGVRSTPYFNGYFHEIIVYSTALSLRDRQNVEGYLAWKWGLQSNLPSTHPYRYGSTISLGSISTTNTF